MYCQWNEDAEDDLRDHRLVKDQVDKIVFGKLKAGETFEYDRKLGTRAARFSFKSKRFVVEFTIEPQNNRPWIQAIELEDSKESEV